MSITPRKPPRATYSDAEQPTGGHAGSSRVAHRLWRVVRATAGWVWQRVGNLRDRSREDATDERRDEDESEAGFRRSAVATLAGSADRVATRADGPAGLPGSSGPAGPELPPRPDIEATETDDGLELRQPDREGAFVTSDEWEEVRP